MDRDQRLIRNTVIYAIGNFATKLLSFLLLPLYTVYLTPHDYGQVDIFFIYIQVIIPIFTCQIAFSSVRYLFDNEDFNSQKHIISNAFFVELIGMTAFVICIGIFWLITRCEYTLYIVSLVVSSSFFMLFQESIRGLKKNSIYAMVGVISSVVQIVCNISFIVGLGMRSKALLISPIIAYIICLSVMIILVNYNKYISVQEVKLSTIKKMLQYSIPLVPDAICWWLLLGFGRVFLSYSHGLASVGIYAVANKFPSILAMVYSIFNLAWQENAYLAYGKDDRDLYYSSIYNALIKLILCALIIALPVTKIIAPLMLGDAFDTAYLYIPVLYISAVLSMLSSFYGSGFESAKKTNGILISTLVAMCTNLICNLALTPKFAILGVALSMVIAYLSLFILRIIRSRQFMTIKVEKKIVIKLGTITTIWLNLYYVDNSFLQITLFFVGCVIFWYTNKKMIILIFDKLKQKREANVF